MSSLPVFHHLPLPGPRVIRYLTVDPAEEPSTQISCSLHNLDFDEFTEFLEGMRHWAVPEAQKAEIESALLVTQYDALSYAWESQTPSRQVVCKHGNSDERYQLDITATCFGALKQLRRTDLPRNLWIDAICIDQSNVPEKSGQVELMSMIYRYATKVIVWLGDSDSAVIASMELIKAFSSHGEDLTEDAPVPSDTDVPKPPFEGSGLERVGVFAESKGSPFKFRSRSKFWCVRMDTLSNNLLQYGLAKFCRYSNDRGSIEPGQCRRWL